jgi:hypothetical protein
LNRHPFPIHPYRCDSTAPSTPSVTPPPIDEAQGKRQPEKYLEPIRYRDERHERRGACMNKQQDGSRNTRNFYI